jgi:hypothetical protein
MNRSLFDDKSTEIQEFTGVIKTCITRLNQDIFQLQKKTASAQSSKSSSQQIDANEHVHQVVLVLQSQLAKASDSFKNTLTLQTQVNYFYERKLNLMEYNNDDIRIFKHWKIENIYFRLQP